MKLKQILLLFLIFNFVINNANDKVINACGSFDFIKNYSQPTKTEDCKDQNEPYCKFVTITHFDGNITKFCAIIHGDYNDEDVLKDVGGIINATISVDDSKFLIGKNSIIYYIFFYILIFLF